MDLYCALVELVPPGSGCIQFAKAAELLLGFTGILKSFAEAEVPNREKDLAG